MNQVRHMTSMAARRVAYRTGVPGATSASSGGAPAAAVAQPIQTGFLGAAKSDVRATQKQMAPLAGRAQTNELLPQDATTNAVLNTGFFACLGLCGVCMFQLITGSGKN